MSNSNGKNVKYLTAEQITKINRFVILYATPAEPIIVKQPSALDMTVNSPRQNVFGRELYPTITLKAANLYRNLVLKHIFANGNKRTAFMATDLFLKANGLKLEVNLHETVDFTVKIATDSLEEKEIEEWIIEHLN